MQVDFKELTKEETEKVLNEAIEAKNKSIFETRADIVKRAKAQEALPLVMLAAMEKRLVSSNGLELENCAIVEFLIDITRTLLPSLTYYLWLNIPYDKMGAVHLLEIYAAIEKKAGKHRVTKKEWDALRPVRIEIAKSGMLGADANLW